MTEEKKYSKTVSVALTDKELETVDYLAKLFNCKKKNGKVNYSALIKKAISSLQYYAEENLEDVIAADNELQELEIKLAAAQSKLKEAKENSNVSFNKESLIG